MQVCSLAPKTSYLSVWNLLLHRGSFRENHTHGNDNSSVEKRSQVTRRYRLEVVHGIKLAIIEHSQFRGCHAIDEEASRRPSLILSTINL